jgi:hypothetical protein
VSLRDAERGIGRIGLVLAAVLLLAGCASRIAPVSQIPAPDTGIAEATAGAVVHWHYFRFRFARPDDDTVARHLDLLVANEVVAPLLAAERDAITLWRFHRRWPDDPTGHQFTWILLAPDRDVEHLRARIEAAPVLQTLRERGQLREFRVDRSAAEDPGAREATSDPAWPDVLLREWPYFIMGASRMWLGLVQAEFAKTDGEDLFARYAAASDAVDTLWFESGNHAFFHHLSALFGYQPVRIIRRDIMTF